MGPQDWDERYASSELVWSAGPNRLLTEQVEGLTPGRCLDLAAGEGRNALWLAEQGWQSTALDFSPVGVEKGRQIAARRGVDMTWEVADATTWAPPSDGFELVIVFYLQLVEEDRRAAHRTAATAVAPGGTLLIVAHALDNLTRGYGGPPFAQIHATPEQVAADLDGTGLTIQRSEHVERTVSTDDGERTAIDLLVRATRP